MSLALHLLGSVQVTWDRTPLKFATEHTRALLAYLAVEADVLHRRTTIATLLWPEENEATARHNLRQALFFLKQSLAVIPHRDTLLQITPTTVQWRSRDVLVDLRAFQERWRLSQGHEHPPFQLCATCVEHFTQAVALYQGEFLQGLLLKENYLFEEWALLLREQTHRQALTMLNALTIYHEQMGAYDRMQHYAARQVALEPWHEEGHRQLMTALAAQGQQSAALRQYESCRRILEQELGAPPSAETTRLYEAIRAGDFDKVGPKGTPWQGDKVTGDKVSESPSHPVTQPPPSAELTSKPHPITPARRHNLPAFLPPMIGRDEQLAQLVALIDNPTERLITIVGMGGMGKTRLALALLETLAAEAPPPFVDGFWFVPLGSVAENAHELAAALAEAALNVLATNVPQGGAPSATLLHYLAQRQLLLVFDNLEHLLLTERTAMAVSNFLLALLQAAPTVKLLTTSRIPLQLLPETVIRLEGLSVPNARSNHEQEKVDDAGLRLFAYHAQRVLPTFTLTHENVTAISALCRQLGGMPLAIQLAAALTPHFRVNELVTAIHQNLALLTSTRRDLDVRHRHFGALLASTWQQLTIDEQRILAQSTIFVGHFSRAAAQAVTGATVADLSALVDKSLIQQPAVAEYQLHPLLHQFAAERMRDQFRALQGEVADQHSRYYLDFVALRSARMARHDLQRAIAEIQHELDNVRQAWAWTVASIRQGCDTTFPGNPADLCRRLDNAIHPLWQFYVITCRYTEGNTLLQGAVLALQSLLAETGEREKVLQQLLSKLLGLQATFLCIQGKNEQAMAIAEEARRKSLLWGSRDGEILGLNGLVHVHYCHGHFAQAKAYAEAILAAIQQPAAANEQPWPSEIAVSAQCMMHIYLGAMARIADDYPAATQHFTQSLQLCQSLGKLMGTMDARMNLANLARCKQNYTAARLEYEEALAIACQLGNLRGEGVVRYELGDVLCGLGDYAAALTQLTRAVALFREIDDPLLESHTTSALAICYSLLGDYATAKNFYEQALHQSESLPMTDAKSAAWLAASLFYHYTGNHQQALAYAQYSHQSAQAQQSRQGEAVALLHIAFADEGLGLWTEAAATYAQAQQLYQRLDIPPSRMEAEAGLARVALTQGETAAALAWVEKLLPILAAHPTGGLYTPFRIYLTCYQVLTANADPRAAALLQQGVTTLRRYANQLPDDTLRCSFLEDVATHRALSQAYLSTNHD